MTALLLSQLGWIMPVFSMLVYLTVGWLIANALVKRGYIEDTINYLFVIILWLPSGSIMVLWNTLKWLLVLPNRFAKHQIEKHSK